MAEKSKAQITMKDMEVSALKTLVEFSYTGEVVITEDNVQALLPVASLLQIPSVREACCQFLLRQLHPSNCLGIRSFADAHACQDLHARSHKYALRNFQEVALTEEFLMLSLWEVEDLVSNQRLNVPSEEPVFGAVLRWVRHDLAGRETHLGQLLQHVRLPLLGRDFLLRAVGEEPLVRASPDAKDLLIEAMRYHLQPEHRTSMSGLRTSLRRPDDLRPYLFAIGGGSLFTIHNECECYNPRNDRWYPINSTQQRRSRAGVASIGRMVYVVGGYCGSEKRSRLNA
ncbi:KLHL17 [Cordylochernes scorpioides]|uniref:KLHL17 n=1 Tax=Cordylochernes scorpioides TaxID=51811 RepID=A0ABY6KSB2_9ARAC|nr:KLHL17 [Cordylochernes scorpioides]